MSHQDFELEAFLALYLEPASDTPRRPQPLRLTVARRPERTRDSLQRLLAAGRGYLKLCQQEEARCTP